MRRGTTPSVVFSLKDVKHEDIDNLCLTLKQDKRVLHKTNFSYDEETELYTVTLTQRETLSFNEGIILIQIKVKDTTGIVFASPIKKIRVKDILCEEVI